MQRLNENTLYQHQKEGTERLLTFIRRNSSRAALLADPVGAGKTPQAVHVALGLQARTILIICPASLRVNWQRELTRWSAGHYRAQVLQTSSDLITGECVITSYDLASRSDVVHAIELRRWDLVIFDESHTLRNPKSNRTRACLISIWNVSTHRLLISGTPLPNGRASEAWPTFMRLAPEAFADWDSYKSRYCVEVYDPNSGKCSYPHSRNLTELGQVARDQFMVKRSRSEVMVNLPPLVRSIVFLDVPRLNQFLAAGDPDFNDLFDTGLMEQIIAAVETGSAFPLDSDAISTVRWKLGGLKVDAAFDYIIDQLETTPRIVVFCHHSQVFDWLQKEFEATPDLGVLAVCGTTPANERQDMVDIFQSLKDTPERAVFLASITAANTGLTLTAADTVVFVEADWTPAVNEQAEGRILRVTQNAELCRAIYLVVPDSLDEAVMSTVLRKQKDIRKALGE